MNPALESASTSAMDALLMDVTRTDNISAHRFFGMGFALGPVQIATHVPTMASHLRAWFRCRCGRDEVYSQLIHDSERDWTRHNVFQSLHRFGSLSRGHLLEDGYSEAQIDAMGAELRAYLVENGLAELQDHPALADLSGGRAGGLYRADRVPPVPDVAADTLLRNMREGRYTRLPERPQPPKRMQGGRDQGARPVFDPAMPGMPQPLRGRAGVDHAGIVPRTLRVVPAAGFLRGETAVSGPTTVSLTYEEV